VTDDVWSSTIWQVIKCALPEENSGSREIITTRNEDVANSLSFNLNCVYKMEPLSRIADQKALFHGSIFGPGKEKECPDELVACGNEILNKCGGVPLAIIVMAGLLATSKDQKTWKPVYKSFSKDQEEVQIRKILYLSYIDLPNYLKSCFLYLSVFPEGYAMRKGKFSGRP
jgi:disease resistance protein RPM1